MAGGTPTYFERSCPKCGKPSHTHSRIALNKVGPTKRDSKKARCSLCRELFVESKEER